MRINVVLPLMAAMGWLWFVRGFRLVDWTTTCFTFLFL